MVVRAMSIDNLLSRLDKVKSTGKDSWITRCPSRDDKTPSMTIRLLDDGRILIHDFGGDSPQEILNSIGLTFSDLFPEPKGQHYKKERRPFPATDILRALTHEALVVSLAANAIVEGRSLDEVDLDRVILAHSRIQSGLDMLGSRYGR